MGAERLSNLNLIFPVWVLTRCLIRFIIHTVEYLTREQVNRELREACERAGDQATLARQLNVTPSHITQVLKNLRPPGTAVLKFLKLERLVLYRRIK